MNPVPVQIVNAASWWLPWIPFLAALVVAGVTWYGVWRSNKTNRKAIAAADKREHDKWRRETLVELTAAVVAKSKGSRELAIGAVQFVNDDPYFHEGPGLANEATVFDHINEAIDDLSYETQRLRLVASKSVIDSAQKLLDAHHAARGAATNWVKSMEREPNSNADGARDEWWSVHGSIVETLWTAFNAIRDEERDLIDAVRTSLDVEPLPPTPTAADGTQSRSARQQPAVETDH